MDKSWQKMIQMLYSDSLS